MSAAAAAASDTMRRETVACVARLGAVSAEALARWQATSTGSARGRLAAAERRELVSAKRPLHGRPALFVATRAGLRWAGVGHLEPSRVSAASAQHQLACCVVAAYLRREYRDHRVIGEPELRAARSGRSPLVQLPPNGGRARTHRPDLLLEPPRALPVAVEVELTVKSPSRLVEICRGWARCRAVAGVLYVASPDAERALAKAVHEVRAGERIAIVPLARAGAG